ncbi:MAG: biopolymer transporter ExbD [Bacteroidetes bacterium]|nr:MAG: biopolymer transporter ExbD [Bacteroidota bacterium]
MSRPKIARKSTWVDMTAFCDMAFLLLSFFILTAKTKAPEAVSVLVPNSVSSKAAEDKDQVLVTITKDGKVFFSLSEEARRADLMEELNIQKQIGLTPADFALAKKKDFFGAPLNTIKSFLSLPPEQMKGDLLPGIPCVDSTNNELVTWVAAAVTIYRGEKMNLMVKGDNDVPYPIFKNVIDAFKKNDQLKFQVVTNQEPIPAGSALSKQRDKGIKQE